MNINKLTMFGWMILILLSGRLCSAQHYFWAENRKIPMVTDSTVVVILRENLPTSKYLMDRPGEKIESYGECVVFRNIKKAQIDSLKERNILYAVAYRANTDPVIVTNIISFVPRVDINQIEREFKQYVRFRDKTESGVYHFVVNDFRGTLKVANAIAESGLVDWCQPDFVIETRFNTADPFYNKQYYLNNTGQTGGAVNIDINAPEAWAITKGCYTTRVAVIDEGVEPHEELGTRYETGFTALDPLGIGLPSSSEYHGQACAGIIAASHDNSLGIAGISPASLIVPVNGIGGFATASQMADGINAGWKSNRGNADVLSNSWSHGDVTINEIADAINNARTQGRGGKGAIVVFSAGKDAGAVEFPGNLNGVITVGAIDKSGNKASYSPTGSSLDLVAPSGASAAEADVYATDLSDDPANPDDNRGKTNGNYITNFFGTSAAAPQVAGVAALMLSINPDLTETQVRTILQQTATDMGAFGFDNNFGFGRINAFAALYAVVGSINDPSPICMTGQFNLTTQLPGISGVTWSSSNPSGLSVNSSTGLATRQNSFSGQVTITANIALPCGTICLPKDVYVGAPPASNATLIFPNGQRGVNPISLCADCTYTFGVDFVPTATSYSWILPSGFSFVSASTTAAPGIKTSLLDGTYTLNCAVNNACGSSWTHNLGITTSGGGQQQIAVYPNPSSTSLTIDETSTSLTISDTDVSAATSNQPFSANLIDESAVELRRGESKNGKIVFDVRDIPKGLYYVHIIYGKELITRQIRIGN